MIDTTRKMNPAEIKRKMSEHQTRVKDMLNRNIRDFLVVSLPYSSEVNISLMAVDVLFDYIISEFADENFAVTFLSELLNSKILKFGLQTVDRGAGTGDLSDLILRNVYESCILTEEDSETEGIDIEAFEETIYSVSSFTNDLNTISSSLQDSFDSFTEDFNKLNERLMSTMNEFDQAVESLEVHKQMLRVNK